MIMTAMPASEDASITVLPARPEPSAVDEANHRIANNLQLLSAMVSLEGEEMGDPAARAVLDTTRRRIAAIASVHRLLHQTRGAGTIDLAVYLEQLAARFREMAGREVAVEARSVRVTAEEAGAIGILVSELVSNAWKYAYNKKQAGGLRITLRRGLAGAYRLEIEDRGHGLTGAVKGTGFGSEIIRLTAQRLGGVWEYHDARPGTRFVLDVGASCAI